MSSIEYTEKLNNALEKLIETEHTKYEIKNGESCNYTPFNFVAKENEEVVGVLTGYTCYTEVYIDDLIVLEEHRKKGIGKQLIKQVENHFKDKNFNNINLVTNGFQAPKFYEKCGFELEFMRENKNNPKLNKYFFVKFFLKGVRVSFSRSLCRK